MLTKNNTKKSQLAVFIALLLWIAILLSNFFFSCQFLFEGNLEQNKGWFPHIYLVSYFFLKMLLPSVYSLWIWGFLSLKFPFNNYKNYGFTAFSFICFVALQYYFIFSKMIQIGAVLIVIIGIYRVAIHHTSIKLFITKVFFESKILSGCFFFLSYTILCSFIPDFYPFSDYSMFNKFADETIVYQLRDKNSNIIPLEKYCNIKNDELFLEGEATNRQLKATNSATKTGSQNDGILGANLLSFCIKKSNGKLAIFQKVQLYVLTFSLKNSKVTIEEKQMGAYDFK